MNCYLFSVTYWCVIMGKWLEFFMYKMDKIISKGYWIPSFRLIFQLDRETVIEIMTGSIFIMVAFPVTHNPNSPHSKDTDAHTCTHMNTWCLCTVAYTETHTCTCTHVCLCVYRHTYKHMVPVYVCTHRHICTVLHKLVHTLRQRHTCTHA